MCRFGSTAALFAIAASAALIPHSGQAVCMWADVGGHRLGVVGQTTGGYSTALSTLDRTVSFDTQVDGKAIFFGYVANKVKLSRASHGDKPYVYEFGTVAREMTGGGWTKHGDLSGKHTYQPSWMLMQTPLITRIYACQPHKGGAGDFRMAGGQGAEWSTNPRPWIHDVQFYRDTNTRLEVTGYGVVYGGVNRNYVTLIDVDERWPCEILKDFSVPTGITAISSRENREVAIHWDTVWGCGRADGGPEKNHDLAANRAPTVSLKAVPDRGEPTLKTTFTAAAKDPDGDEVEYRFRLPGGQWTPWGPNPSVTDQFSKVGTYTAEVQAMDINENLSDIAKVKVTVEEREVYIFGNLHYPISTTASMAAYMFGGEADYSVTLAQEFLQQGKFGGIFDRLSPEARRVSKEYGGMFGKMVVIDTAGELVGIYSAQKFTDLNPGFLNAVYDWPQNYNSYKGKVATLPNGRQLRVKENAMASPLIVDVDGDNKPSLLAGRGWQTPRAFSPELTDYRKVNLDGKGAGWWEWIGPKDALLVDVSEIAKDKHNISRFVFGNATWGGRWKHGFEPLVTLDKNSTGGLEGEELSSLGLWTDRNANAQVEEGEVGGADEFGITYICAKPDEDSPKGNYMAKAGVSTKGNRSLSVWDWWSAKSPLSYLTSMGRVDWKRGPVKGLPRIAVSGSKEDWKDGSLDMADGGSLSFYTDKQGSWFVRVTAKIPGGKIVDTLYPLHVDEDHLDWSVVSGNRGVNNHLFWAGGKLVGITVMNDGRYSSWSGKISGGAIPLVRK